MKLQTSVVARTRNAVSENIYNGKNRYVLMYGRWFLKRSCFSLLKSVLRDEWCEVVSYFKFVFPFQNSFDTCRRYFYGDK